MSRPKGSRDQKPRKMSPSSLENVRTGIPGHQSAVVRVYGPAEDVQWFTRLSPQERGRAIHCALMAFEAMG